MKIFVQLLLACAALVGSGSAIAQEAPSGRALGAVTKVDAAQRMILLKSDAGAEITVMLQPAASFRRVAPGESDLRNAATIGLGEVAVGDRVLARGTVSDDQKAIAAIQVVVMSQGDIEKKQAADRADWDRRGVNGVVSSITAEEVTVSVRGAAGARTVVVIPAAKAIIRRYAPDSVKFADAKPSTLAEIKPGDQVRARGARNEDGTKVSAEEIVSGSFRTIAGVILSVDGQQNAIRINNLETKKPMLVKINPDSSVRKLQPQVAQFLAARLHGGPAAGGAEGAAAVPAGGRGGDAPGRGAAGRGPGDLTQMIDRTPATSLAELKAGDALVISSTVGARADEVTAITILAGVEPILTKPGTKQMALGDWNTGDLGGGIGAP
jgi:transcription antitermination factor NusG